MNFKFIHRYYVFCITVAHSSAFNPEYTARIRTLNYENIGFSITYALTNDCSSFRGKD